MFFPLICKVIFSSKLRKANGILSVIKLRHFVPFETLKSIYYSLFHSHLLYAAIIWGQNIKRGSRLCLLQKKTVRIMTFSNYDGHSAPLFARTGITFLPDFIFSLNVKLVHQALNKVTPVAVENTLNHNFRTHHYFTRTRNIPLIEKPKAKHLIMD